MRYKYTEVSLKIIYLNNDIELLDSPSKSALYLN